MQIQRIEPLSEWLKHVKALGRINSRTLGFLPEGAFDQACQDGNILVAIDQGVLAGYVLYRVSRGQAKIVHLCKDLFRRYRRLGIYEWTNLLETAKGDPEREIMAFRFRDTEVFENPVPRAEMCEIMEEYDDRGSQIQAPVQISKATFFRLYRKGTGQ